MTQLELLKKYGLSIRGTRGQHLLIDENIQRKIVESILPEACTVEIGSGLGALTHLLALKVERLIGIESDIRFIDILNRELKSKHKNLELIHQDILEVNLKELASRNKKLQVVGNLPYYITTQILLHLIKYRSLVSQATLMVQKEIAERMFAVPGTKAYGRLSILMRYYADGRKLFDVSKNCFLPKPKVDSSVVQLVFSERFPQSNHGEAFFEIVQAAFGERRKHILNALTDGLARLSAWEHLNREEVKVVLNQAGLNESLRAENLFIEDFMRLTLRMAPLRQMPSDFNT